jgi:hypothetical protein
VGTDFWLFFGVVSLLRVLRLVTLQLLNEAQHPVAGPAGATQLSRYRPDSSKVAKEAVSRSSNGT